MRITYHNSDCFKGQFSLIWLAKTNICVVKNPNLNGDENNLEKSFLFTLFLINIHNDSDEQLLTNR